MPNDGCAGRRNDSSEIKGLASPLTPPLYHRAGPPERLADRREDVAGDPVLEGAGFRLGGPHDQFVEAGFADEQRVGYPGPEQPCHSRRGRIASGPTSRRRRERRVAFHVTTASVGQTSIPYALQMSAAGRQDGAIERRRPIQPRLKTNQGIFFTQNAPQYTSVPVSFPPLSLAPPLQGALVLS
jgi:hypothetical protein